MMCAARSAELTLVVLLALSLLRHLPIRCENPMIQTLMEPIGVGWVQRAEVI